MPAAADERQRQEQLVRAAFTILSGAYASGSRDPAPDPAAVFHPELVIVPLRAALEETAYRGPGAFRDFLAASRELWTELHVELDKLVPLGDGILAIGSIHMVARASGVPVDQPLYAGFRFENGLIRWIQSGTSRDEVVAGPAGRE